MDVSAVQQSPGVPLHRQKAKSRKRAAPKRERPVSTRVGRKRTKTEAPLNGSCEYILPEPGLASRQRQFATKQKLRQEFIQELERLRSNWSAYKRGRMVEIIEMQHKYEQHLSSIQSTNCIEEALAIQGELNNLEQEQHQLNHDMELHLISSLLRLLQPSSTAPSTSMSTPVIDTLLSWGTRKSYVTTFMEKFHKSALEIGCQSGFLQKTHAPNINNNIMKDICPVHKTRLVMSVEDSTLSCTHCGYTSTYVDTSVDIPTSEDGNTGREMQFVKLFALFEKCQIDAQLDASLQQGVAYLNDWIERKKPRGVSCDFLPVSEVMVALKQSKDKTLVQKFSLFQLHLASRVNGVEIPSLTPEEKSLIQRLMLLIREPLQTLKPQATNFNVPFSFIKICQILAVKDHKAFLRFIPWIDKLTHKGRLHKQEQYWFNVTQYAGLPVIYGQEALTDSTITILRLRYNITTARD